MRGETGFRPEEDFAEQFNPETVIEQLRPKIIETEEGVQHTVYTFGADKPVRVMFCNPEELPFSDSLAEQHRLFMFGNQPRHRQAVDWETFVKKIRQYSNPIDEPINPRVLDTSTNDTLFIVQTNPRALLDMALVLGVPSDTKKEITEARRLSEQRQATEISDWTVDAIIAAKLVGSDERAHIPAVRSTDAEALVLLALTGNKEAENFLNAKVRCLQNIDEAKKNSPLARRKVGLGGEKTRTWSWYRTVEVERIGGCSYDKVFARSYRGFMGDEYNIWCHKRWGASSNSALYVKSSGSIGGFIW